MRARHILPGLMVAALAATAAPLLVYTLSLAAFGLPHVLVELRYVDERFNARLGRGLRWGLLALLAGLVLVRITALGGDVPLGRGTWELLLLLGLAAATLPTLWRAGPGPVVAGVMLLVLVGIGLAMDPALALVLLALLHNVTPVGFLAERLEGLERRRAMIWCALTFVLVPGFIASGAPGQMLQAVGLSAREFTLLAAGPLESHLGLFVPAALRETSGATWLFAAAVYLQVLHYAVVLYVLPRLQGAVNTALLPWPTRRAFKLLVAALGAVFFVGFALSFGEARDVYGVFAAMHAWVEVPLLLLALAGLPPALKACAA